MTAVITGERGDGRLTRQGLEEYVSDCVILLDHRVVDQVSTRRLRVVKYRGTAHGTNEYPFVIDEHGLSVLPITSLGLDHPASSELVSTGVPQLDAMLSGHGYYRGSTVLISGTAGVGKTSLSAHFADAMCRRGERCLFLGFEESESQLLRNMQSIGLNLAPHIKRGLLRTHMSRPTAWGLELHLLKLHQLVDEFAPAAVVVDPIDSFAHAGTRVDANAVLVRLIDYVKAQGVTAVFTNLTAGGAALEGTDAGISSLVDTWLLLRDIELGGERNRGLYVLKSRGMAHSNQIREFVLTPHGIELLDVYTGPEGVLTGSARIAQEARERAATLARRQQAERQQRELDRRQKVLQAQVAALEAELAAVAEETQQLTTEDEARQNAEAQERDRMRQRREARNGDATGTENRPPRTKPKGERT